MYDSLPNTSTACIFPSPQVLLPTLCYPGIGRFLVRVMQTSFHCTELKHSFLSGICHRAWRLIVARVTPRYGNTADAQIAVYPCWYEQSNSSN